MHVNDSRTAWLPYDPKEISGLPHGLTYLYWDGSEVVPGDPKDVRFLVGPTVPGAERALAKVLPMMPTVEVLQLLSSGYDQVLPLLDRLSPGARVATARGVHRESTAEMAVTLLLALSRGLGDLLGRQARGEWQPSTFRTLVGKRVIVVGYGAVGSAVAARLGPLGCAILPVARTDRTTAAGRVHGIDELPTLLPAADAVILCAPLTDETRGMFGSAELALLKDGALLVNVARGELVDTDALVREVRGGRLRAALDVVDPEPLPPDHSAWALPGLLITPHVAAFTDAFPQASKDFLKEQLQRFVRGEDLENVVGTTEGGSHTALREPTTSSGHRPPDAGPETDLVRVFRAYEHRGHAGPATAWKFFTSAWNWSASLPHAVPAGGDASVAHPVPGGFVLTGRWQLPPGVEDSRWLALPAVHAPAGEPDVFVMAAKDVHRAAGPETVIRLEGHYIPAGFASCGEGVPLREEDGAFLWTAVTAMALGTARRLTECLTECLATSGPLTPYGTAKSEPAVPPAAEGLAAAVSEERETFMSLLRRVGKPEGGSHGAKDLAVLVRRATGMVHQLVAAAYEQAMPFDLTDGRNPLEALVVDSTPLLQHARYTVDLLPAAEAIAPAGR